ncbi:hypothetical protein C8F04DRAFT_1071509 [Mycena alexandri]|uniref:Transmembrane protein n=1 Tax=Mycena alexandri TaxID=1745969 RepID=A0AAD6TGZ9_9AGAR|nr:hypothetical protein C8F04DRAFT_1071509 [Mycena alexandri]
MTSTISGTPAASSTPLPPAALRPGTNLYLYTFLSTLLLLLAVTCGFCGRAVFLRRRLRRRFNNATAQGLVLAPAEQGSHKLTFNARPKLFDVWLTEKQDPSPSWDDITPISVQPLPSLYSSDWNTSVSSKLAPSTVGSAAASTTSVETLQVQVSVLIAMPRPPTPLNELEDDHDHLPEVALGFTLSHYPS